MSNVANGRQMAVGECCDVVYNRNSYVGQIAAKRYELIYDSVTADLFRPADLFWRNVFTSVFVPVFR